MYLSKFHSVNCYKLAHELLTRSAMPDLLCCDPKNGDNLGHYLNGHVRHFGGQRHFCVHLETSKKHIDALKDIQKCVLARTNVLSCLRTLGVKTTHAKVLRIRTERRTPIPAKITVVGENACQMNMSAQILDKWVSLGIPGQQFQLSGKK